MELLINKIKPYTYLIKFKPTGQVYYGSRSKNVRLGLDPTQDLMIKYFTSCKSVKQLINKYGLSAFEWEIRRTFDTAQKAILWEQKVLRRCKVLHDPRWFNQNIAGYIVPSADGLRKISEFHKNKPKSEEHRRHISEALVGKKKSAKHCANLSKAQKGHIAHNKGIPISEEQRRKQSMAMKGKSPVNKGISMSEEQKNKISITKKAKIYTEEQRQKFRDAQLKARLGKHLSKESKIKMSKSHMGKIFTDNHRKNLSLSHLGKKRNLQTTAKGEKVHTAKLSVDQVLNIRKSYKPKEVTMTFLAKQYKVSVPVISDIINRKTWTHI